MDDLCQSGWVGLLEGMKTNVLANDTYQYTSVLRSIKRESCKFWFAFDVPEKILRKFRKIFVYLKMGNSLDAILIRLKITEEEWEIISALLTRSNINHPILTHKNENILFILEDILSISSLTDTEKRIIIARLNQTTDALNMCRTTIWKHLQNIRYKLAGSGYGI